MVFSETLTKYLNENDWERSICPVCNRGYWSKTYNKKENCQQVECVPEGEYFFSKILKKKPRYQPIDKVNEEFIDYFKKLGYTETTPREIYRGKDTLLTICGLQRWDDVFEGKAPVTSVRYVFNQPSIRLQDLEKVRKTGRHLTSFNMLSIQQFDANWKRYVDVLDDLLSYLSDAPKIPVQELTIVEDTWEGGAYGGSCLEFMFGGMEIGTIVYVNRPLECVDVGLGLERISWLLNKSESIFDVVGPISDSEFKDYGIMDTYRTLTLMIGQGMKPGKKGVGSIIRSFIKDNFYDLRRSDLDRLVEFYYDQWSKFIELYVPKNDVVKIIRSELNRELNSRKFHLISKLKNEKENGSILSRVNLPYDKNSIFLHENGIFSIDDAREEYSKRF
ncbi:MAG: alanine--tRNA ligase-related protein [Candidatus Omnitrophica bacterium]|nr:alanine--tRNA ligase-related protein [Candidatus Omnitrophota bacterium]